MGCIESKPDSDKESDHKQKKKKKDSDQSIFSKQNLDRISNERKLFKFVVEKNQLGFFDQSLMKVREYYSGLKECKGRQGLECDFVQFDAWCHYCANIDLTELDLEYLDDQSFHNFNINQQINIQIIGPKDSPYSGKYFQLIINIPSQYPKDPPLIYFGSSLYHINVNQETNQILFKKLTKKYWRQQLRLFQIVIDIIRLLEEPDCIKNYFEDNEQNCQIYETYLQDREAFKNIALVTTNNQDYLDLPWRDGGDPMKSYDLQLIQEQQLLYNYYEKKDDYAGLINLDDSNQANKKESDSQINRRKTAQKERERQIMLEEQQKDQIKWKAATEMEKQQKLQNEKYQYKSSLIDDDYEDKRQSQILS